MRKIDTTTLEADLDRGVFSEDEVLWLYNGLDCMITASVFKTCYALAEDRPLVLPYYEWNKSQQAISLQLTRRGTLVDITEQQALVFEFRKRLSRFVHIFNRLCDAAVLRSINPNSPKQLQWLFYEQLKMPEQKTSDKGKWKVSTNRECLEKLYNLCTDERRALIKVLLSIRDLKKLIEVVETGPSADGRMRCSYNVAGTDTGRWSSSETAFGEGMNKQNVTHELRRIFIPDPWAKMGQADQEQAESRVVAYDSEDENYIAACNSGDLHTYCCRLFWPKLPWNGDLKKDRLIADRIFYRHFSYRDMSKRGGHASNYYAIPWTISRNLKIPMKSAEEFQDVYFHTFPGIRKWQRERSLIIQQNKPLITPFGMERYFFGRPDDDATLRQAIAFVPQSVVGTLTNIVLHRLLQREEELQIQILENGHDAVIFQFADRREDEIIPKMLPYFDVPFTLKGRTVRIPFEFKVGYNWHELEKWKGNGSTSGQQRPERTTLLDRIIL